MRHLNNVLVLPEMDVKHDKSSKLDFIFKIDIIQVIGRATAKCLEMWPQQYNTWAGSKGAALTMRLKK